MHSDPERTEMTITEKILTSLAELQTGQQGILDHLAQMNGTQAKLLERMNTVEVQQELHPNQCVLKERVLTLESEVHQHFITVNAVRSTNRRWWDKLTPIIYIVAGAIGMVVLRHIDIWINK
jgi:hypothetical protein